MRTRRRNVGFVVVLALAVLGVAACGGDNEISTGADDEPASTTAGDVARGPILVESVAPGDTVSSPVKIAGRNNTFESNVRLRVLGADGRVLADTFTTGKGEPGQWGPFEAAVTFDRGTDTRGTIVAFTNSAETGAMTGVVEIPVRFG